MASLYLVWQVKGTAISSYWYGNFDFLSKMAVFLYVASCSLIHLLCIGIRAEEKKSKINNASGYIFHLITQKLFSVSVVVSVKMT